MRPTEIRISLLVISLLVLARASFAQDTMAYPAWMRDAVIYGIKPSSFTEGGSYDDISQKIPELALLGVNTIWLQPVFRTSRGGQGYDITDYFSLRPDLGTADQLKKLVQTARHNGMRVLFDVVPNHTSIDHPYAADVIARGKASPYYDFYQHDNDGAPYASYYHRDSSGFVYYFWKNLVNLNYNNERVQRMIIDACKYWIKEYNIDGYRFDAVWAVNARAPLFGRRLRQELKSLKPDVLLLAEDKGNSEEVYKKGFDAAYDWTADTGWISQWSWEYKHHPQKSFTVFNHPDLGQRKTLLEASLFNNPINNVRVLRFLENNDLPRFIAGHTLQQTKMAAAILFSLPGIPLLFCGQEIGFAGHPYSRRAVFDARHSIREQDSLKLFSFYQSLIRKRSSHFALRSADIRKIAVPSTTVVAYSRGAGRKKVVVLANLDSVPASVSLPADVFTPHSRIRDLLGNATAHAAEDGKWNLAGYGAAWLQEDQKK